MLASASRAPRYPQMLALHVAMLSWHAAHGKRVAPCTPAHMRSPTVYCMASKDGEGRSNCKKRRKKQREAAEAAEAAAGRVTSNSLISVRKQIMYAKAYRAMHTKSVSPSYKKSKTSFRRQKKAAQAEDEEEARKKAEEEEDTTNLSVPVLFVDGYNIIGRWARLKKRRDKGDMAGAPWPKPCFSPLTLFLPFGSKPLAPSLCPYPQQPCPSRRAPAAARRPAPVRTAPLRGASRPHPHPRPNPHPLQTQRSP